MVVPDPKQVAQLFSADADAGQDFAVGEVLDDNLAALALGAEVVDA